MSRLWQRLMSCWLPSLYVRNWLFHDFSFKWKHILHIYNNFFIFFFCDRLKTNRTAKMVRLNGKGFLNLVDHIIWHCPAPARPWALAGATTILLTRAEQCVYRQWTVDMKPLLRLWSGLGTRMEQERHWAGLCWGPAKFEYAYKCLCKVCILKYPICTDSNVRYLQNKLKKSQQDAKHKQICRHVQKICSRYQENSVVSNRICQWMNLCNAVAWSCYFAYICTPHFKFAQELCPCGSDDKHTSRTLIVWSCALPGPWLTISKLPIAKTLRNLRNLAKRKT